jgi:hypothetical protein
VIDSKAIQHFKYRSAQNLCDSLLAFLRSNDPEVSRKEGPNWCSFIATRPGSKRRRPTVFAYVYHQKKKGLKIYPRADEADESNWRTLAATCGVIIEKRPAIKEGWQGTTPFSFFVDSVTVESSSALLLKVAGIEAPPPANPIEYPSEIDARQFVEGESSVVTVNRYERDGAARRECIKYFGCQCIVCGFDFLNTYGSIGKGFIHVHHLVPVAQIGKRYQVVPNRDMCPVCPNCHEMLHTKKPPFTIEEMRAILRSTGDLKL